MNPALIISLICNTFLLIALIFVTIGWCSAEHNIASVERDHDLLDAILVQERKSISKLHNQIAALEQIINDPQHS